MFCKLKQNFHDFYMSTKTGKCLAMLATQILQIYLAITAKKVSQMWWSRVGSIQW